MRKITLLFLFLTISFSVKAQFTEGFESGIPSDWTVINNGSANGWVQNTAPIGGALEGTATASIFYNNTAHDDYLITPAITVATGTNEFLSFSIRSRSSTFLEPYEVLLSTTDTMESSFTVVLQASSDAPNVWTLNSFDLSSYNGQTVYVAIKATGTNEWELFVDDVFNGVQSSPPNCATNPTPADSATDVASPGGITAISWTAPATGDAPSGYEIFWGTTSGSLTSLGTLADTSVNITGLNFSTTYYWMIVPLNNGGSATGCAEWSFTTGAVPSAPANDLIAGAIALTLDEGTACGANTIIGITNQSTTDSGVATPMCGSYGTPTTQGDLWYTFVAPASGNLTLNTTNVVGISSVAGAVYSGTPGSLTEEGCNDFNSGWPWMLSGLTAGNTYYLRVWDYLNNDTGTFDLCGYYSTCPVPTGVTATPSATTETVVTWTAGGTETDWSYEYGPTGFTQGSGTSGTTTTASLGLTTLTEGETYDIYVQANCGGGDDSTFATATWTQPLPPIVPSYSEDFATYPADRWSEASGPFMMPTGTTSNFLQDDFGNDPAHANGQCARVNIYGTTLDEYLISPKFNLSGATYYLNFDIAYTTFLGTTASTFESGDYVALIVTEDNGTTWTELIRWDDGTTISNTGESISEISLTGYGAEVQFAFYAFKDTFGGDNNFYIDNFQITTTTLKVESNAIENFTLFPTIVKDKLSFTSQERVDVLTIYNIMGQEVLSRKPVLTNGSINVSSLSSGMYIVKVKAGNSLGSYKIIKE